MARVSTPDYKAIAAKKITKPSKTTRKPKWLIYGRNKKGKTYFQLTVNKIPGEKILIIDPEHGTDEFKKQDPDVWHVTRWEDLDPVLKFLESGDHDYTWVGVDGLTRISNMALMYIKGIRADRALTDKPRLVDRRDYGNAGELVKELLVRLHNLDMGVIYSAQERQVEADESEEDEDVEGLAAWFVADLPKGARAMVNSLVDVIARIYVVNVELSNSEKVVRQRRLWLSVSERYDTGYRSEYVLPDMIKNPTVSKLLSAIRTGTVPTTRKKVS